MALARHQVADYVENNDEFRTKMLYDTVLEQEVIWMGLKHLEPVNDVKPHPMFPGRVEKKAIKHRHRYFGKPRAHISHRDTTSNARSHRPWRDLNMAWPANNAIVEVQVRSSGKRNDNRLANVYHSNKIWYHADSNKRVQQTVERWRMMPA